MPREQQGDEVAPGHREPGGEGIGSDRRAIPVMLAEHHPIYRMGIRRALAVQPDVSIVAETSNGIDALALTVSLGPGVVVAASDLPDGDGIALVRGLRLAPSRPAVILLSDDEGDDALFEAVRLGAAALLSRRVAADALVETVLQVGRGEAPIDRGVLSRPAVAERVLRLFGALQSPPDRSTPGVPLSPRELEVLACLARGKSNKEIGRILSISDQTVKNHLSSVLRKLAVSDRTQAVVLAVRRGWIDLSEKTLPSSGGPGAGPGRRTRRHAAA